jgi:hypothetical protein
MPKKLSSLLLFLGTSATFTVYRLLWEHLRTVFATSSHLIAAYACCAGFVSFCIAYYFGPPQHPRALSLIQWFIQIIAVLLLLASSDNIDIGVSFIVILILGFNFPFRQTYSFFKWLRNIWNRPATPRPLLLTDEEYTRQGDMETTKALKELRTYCRSPKCDAWKTMSQLNDPIRFAHFVEGNPHLSDDEVTVYEQSFYGSISPGGEQEEMLSSDEDDHLSLEDFIPDGVDISSIQPC